MALPAGMATTVPRPAWLPADSLCVGGLLLLTCLPLVQVAGFDFVALDDPQYVTESPLVQQGLSPFALWDALTEFHADNWHPLVWWTLMLDHQLFGNRPAAYHLVNLGWHLGGVAMLFVALRELTGDRWRSATVAAVFGIHPLHVESVAWISERKDVVSGFFWMLGLWTYSRWIRSGRSPGWWLAVTASLACGLMAKQIVVTLPCVFLLLDGWPLGRMHDRRLGRTTVSRFGWLVVEKLPWFALSLAAGLLAIGAQQTALQAAEDWPPALRVSNAAISVFRYLGKVFVPAGLSVQYPFEPPASWIPVLAAVLGLAAITTAAGLAARRRPAILVGWLWFLGTLMPVIGLIQLGKQSMADRYMYLPLIGITIGILWGIPFPRRRAAAGCLAGFCVIGLAVLSVLTAMQAAVWKNTTTLYRHALHLDPTNDTVLYAVGFQALESGDVDTGLDLLHRAVKEDRRRWLARQSFSTVHDPERLKVLNRRWAEIYTTLGKAEASRRRPAEAIADFRQAVSVDPTHDGARMLLGMLLADQGADDLALEQFNEILRQQPAHADAALARRVLLQSRERPKP